jgi:hypothetical protein
MNGMIALLMQYFKKGLVVVARNLKCRLKRINVVMFQLIMNTAVAAPTIAVLSALTCPRYSGARKSELAPKVCMKLPLTVANRINQNNSSTWNFLKCRITNWTGNE